jgi:glutamate synthase (NADPH) large chain
MVAVEPLQSEAAQTAEESALEAAGKGRHRHAGKADVVLVRELVERHLRFTGSTLALKLLDDWDAAQARFVKVYPHEYRRALTEMRERAKAKSTAPAARQRAAA